MFDFALDFMNRVDFPEEAKDFFSEKFSHIKDDIKLKNDLTELVERYNQKGCKFSAVKKQIHLRFSLFASSFETDMIFYLLCLKSAFERYKVKNYSEMMFYETFADLKYKLVECREVKGQWGTFVAPWFDRFFSLDRFALGRFQYEFFDYPLLKYKKHGAEIRHKTRIVNFHIPASGEPITYEVRLDSYKKAYGFYKEHFQGNKMVLMCFSWLLFKKHYDFLPDDLNIIDFMNDFEIVQTVYTPVFGDKWRIFGSASSGKNKNLPEKTRLQRAYKQWLLKRKWCGEGLGIIVFDGEKILTRSK